MKHHPITALFLYASLLAALFVSTSTQLSAQTDDVSIHDLTLTGYRTSLGVEFTASGTVRIANRKGAELSFLAGDVALLQSPELKHGEFEYKNNEYRLLWTRGGEYGFTVRFLAKVEESNGLESVAFQFLSAPVRKLELHEFPANAKVEIHNAAAPIRLDDAWSTYLAPTGEVSFQWQTDRDAGEGELFYTAEITSIAAVAPGMIKQNQRIALRVMQGEMSEVVFRLRGPGQVSLVEGPNILGWRVDSSDGDARQLTVRFNRPQVSRLTLLISSQSALPKLPVATQPLLIEPIAATRISGHLLLLSDGAVNLGVSGLRNLSQVSPDQVPLDPVEAGPLRIAERQAFGFRYAGVDQSLNLSIEDILPEVAVSSVTLYHLGLNESIIDVDMNLDIRDAPLRDLSLILPREYSLVSVSQSQLGDYTFSPADSGSPELRLAFSAPLIGQHALTLQLERNDSATTGSYEVPKIDVPLAKSVRGYVGVTTDPGIKVARLDDEGLTEVIPSYFPVKNEQLQVAFRLRERSWNASLAVERLSPTIHAEAFHLFSLADDAIFASSIITCQISGAPIQDLTVVLNERYENVELSGANIRDWRQNGDRFHIQFHSPVSGNYSLLATYETRLPEGRTTLEFDGAAAADAHSERGYIVFVSPNQAELALSSVESPLLTLEPRELPPEYQIMVDAPIVASLHYTDRPFAFEYEVVSLPRQQSIDQIVELAHIKSSVNKTGEILCQADYVYKSKNVPNFSLRLPEGARVWKVVADQSEPVVARDGERYLIPIANNTRATSRHLSIKYTLQAPDLTSFEITAPILDIPVLQSQWTLSPDAQYELVFQSGSIDPDTPPRSPTEAQRLFSAIGGDSSLTNNASRLVVFAISASLSLIGYALIRFTNAANRLPWLPPLVILVAACGLFATSHWALSTPRHELNAATSTSLTFRDTVQAPGDSHSITIGSRPVRDSPSAKLPVLAIVIACLLSPFVLAGPIAKRLPRRLALPVLATANIVLLITLLQLQNGAAFALAFIAASFFAPIILTALTYTVPIFRGRFLWRNTSTTGAAIIAFLCSALAPSDAKAQDDDPDGLRFTRSEPVSIVASVNDTFATVTLDFTWEAKAGETIPLLFLPAVVTELHIPVKHVTLNTAMENGRSLYTLSANRSGAFPIALTYQTPVVDQHGIWTFAIQSIPSLVYSGTFTFERGQCQIASDAAVGVDYLDTSPDQTIASIRFTPGWSIEIACKPLDRDTRLEDTIFYAETVNAFRPQAGATEGTHFTTLRIAQGQLKRLELLIPAGATITNVQSQWLDSWRFDPASRTLSIIAERALEDTSSFVFTSQTNASALPYEAELHLPRFPQAQSEIGWLGIALSSEEQLRAADPDSALAAVSLNDFPKIPGHERRDFSLRRAYRYTDTNASLRFQLAKVEPEIRVTSESLTSLGEDRVLHTATLTTQILRSGVFNLQLRVPEDYDIEKISGEAVSHWTEQDDEHGRLVTLHFKKRTDGSPILYLTLSSSGLSATPRWEPPHIEVLGASKQTGTLTLAPELGLRLNLIDRKSVSQLDPSELRNRDKNRLAFRILEKDWRLAFEVQPIDPWVECALLHDLAFKSGLAQTKGVLRYEIKNAGVKQLRVRLPQDAVAPQFTGEHIAGYQAAPDQPGVWQIDFDRRLVNVYVLGVEFQQFPEPGSSRYQISGIETLNTKAQESFLSLRSEQRLELNLGPIASNLTQVEWQQVPDSLRSKASGPVSRVYRAVSHTYVLSLDAKRLSMAQLLPAEIRSVSLSSILSESGQILTRATFQIDSGHKPYLSLKLPENARFWSCYVDGLSVWPVEKQDRLVVPLSPTGAYREAVELEINYLAEDPSNEEDLFSFVAPQCDLPLENITWRLYLPGHYNSRNWQGNLDRSGIVEHLDASFDLNSLLAQDSKRESRNIESAASLLTLGNALAQEGNQLDAKQALETAYNLSLNDLDFNEDARVQWNNLRVQQAMVGLTSRRNNAFTQIGQKPEIDGQLSGESTLNFSPEQANELLQTANTAEENRALSELAQRFVQHQDSALRSPSGLAFLYPEHGALHTFTRKLQSEPWQDLRIDLELEPARSGTSLPFLAALVIITLLSLLVRPGSVRTPSRTSLPNAL